MNWIQRYTQAVADRLPAKQRDDVEKELRSLLLDALEDRTGKRENFTAEEQWDLLREYGPPEEMADRYAPRQKSLIAEPLFAIYKQVLMIVLTVSLIGIFAARLLQVVVGQASVWSMVVTIAGSLWSVTVSVVGWLTIIFAAVQYFAPPKTSSPADEEKLAWDPKLLPEVTSDPRVSKVGAGISLAVAGAAVLAGNILGWRLGLFGGDPVPTAAVFDAAAVAAVLPWWNLLWGLGIVHEILLLHGGRWTAVARYRALAVDAAGIALLVVLVNMSLLVPEQFVILGDGQQAAELQRAGEVLVPVLRGVFIGAIAFTVWDMVEQIVALRRSRQKKVF